jgi:hypothetical protein
LKIFLTSVNHKSKYPMTEGAWRGDGRGRVDSDESDEVEGNWRVSLMPSSCNTKMSARIFKVLFLKPIVPCDDDRRLIYKWILTLDSKSTHLKGYTIHHNCTADHNTASSNCSKNQRY